MSRQFPKLFPILLTLAALLGCEITPYYDIEVGFARELEDNDLYVELDLDPEIAFDQIFIHVRSDMDADYFTFEWSPVRDTDRSPAFTVRDLPMTGRVDYIVELRSGEEKEAHCRAPIDTRNEETRRRLLLAVYPLGSTYHRLPNGLEGQAAEGAPLTMKGSDVCATRISWGEGDPRVSPLTWGERTPQN